MHKEFDPFGANTGFVRWRIGVLAAGAVGVAMLATGPAQAQTSIAGTADLGVIQDPMSPFLDGTLELAGDYRGPALDAWSCAGGLTEVSPGTDQGSATCTDNPGGQEGPQLPPTTYGALPSSFTLTLTLQVSGSTWQLNGSTGWATLQCSGVVNPLTGGGVQELQGACTAG
jgi:hypothetical protein